MTLTSSCRGYLVVIENGESVSQIPVTSETCYIGRDSECDVRLRDQNVNDKHCFIKVSLHKKVTIYNLCPENPVLLNNVPLNTDGTAVNHGDIIQILDNTFKWENVDKESSDMMICRSSCQISQNHVPENIQKRFSAPDLIYEIDRENIDPGPQPEIIVTPKTSPETDPLLDSPSVKKLTSSCTTNRSSTIKHDIIKRVSNTCTKDVNRVRRSRLFSKTFKATKAETNTPEKEKTPTASRVAYGKVSTLSKEVNRTPSKEVKSRHEFKRSSIRGLFRKSIPNITPSAEMNGKQNLDDTIPENVNVLKKEKTDVADDNQGTTRKEEDTRIVHLDSKADCTLETTIPIDTNEIGSILHTPKRFTSAYHSTPKPAQTDDEFLSNSEENLLQNVNSVVFPSDSLSLNMHSGTTKTFDLDSKSMSASPVKPMNISNYKDLSQITKNDVQICSSKSKPKKKEFESSRSTSEMSVEIPRNTRGRSNLLMKTLEEHNEDNIASNERSLTTPEKSTESHSVKTACTEETEFESHSPEKKLETTPELSSENTNTASSQDENREKSLRSDDSGVRRNLSYISPPENNRSQEFMDSVVSTPKKLSMDDEEEQAPASLCKVSLAESVSTPKSPYRYRRSTGIVPCVGTPSDVYRTKKSILTPANRLRLNRTSMEVEVSMGPRDSLSGLVKSGKFVSRKQSSERKSTPLKSDKSVVRDSLQLHSPIIEDYSMEKEEDVESQNESTNNDSKFKFVVSRRRRRFAMASFAAENRIMEESESNQSEVTSADVHVDGDESLMPLSSFDEENSDLIATRIVVNSDSNTVDGDSTNGGFSKLDSDDHESELESRDDSALVKNSMLPKSILTPLPRHYSALKEKSAKKVTFMDVKHSEDSCNDTMSSMYSVPTSDSTFNSKLTCSSINTPDVTSCSNTNDINESQVHFEDDEKLYVADQSSTDVHSETSAVSSSETKRGKRVKRLSSARKASTPCLSGIKRLLTTPKSAKSDYLNVSGIKELMETPEAITKLLNSPEKVEGSVVNVSNVQMSAPVINIEDTSVSPECNSTSVGSKANDSVFLTPLARRCSKHLRIHRTSLCHSLASEFNSTLLENKSHDCSASLDNSVVENEVKESDGAGTPPRSPNTIFKSVVVELKQKMLKLQRKEPSDVDAKEEDVNGNEINIDGGSAVTVVTLVDDESKDRLQHPENSIASKNIARNELDQKSHQKNSISVLDKMMNGQVNEKAENSAIQKEHSLVEHSAATNDTFKTCSLASNSTFIMESTETEELGKIDVRQETDASCVTEEPEKLSRFFAAPISPVSSCENTNNVESLKTPVASKEDEQFETQLNVTFEIISEKQTEQTASISEVERSPVSSQCAFDDNVDESLASRKVNTVPRSESASPILSKSSHSVKIVNSDTVSKVQYSDSESDEDDLFHDSLTSPKRSDEIDESQKEEDTNSEKDPTFEDSRGSTAQSNSLDNSEIDNFQEQALATQTSVVHVKGVEQPAETLEMSSIDELISTCKSASAAERFDVEVVNEKLVHESAATTDSEIDEYKKQTPAMQTSISDSEIIESVEKSTATLEPSIDELVSNGKSAADISQNMVLDEQTLHESTVISENSNTAECATPNHENVDDVEQYALKSTIPSPEKVSSIEQSTISNPTLNPEKANDVEQSEVKIATSTPETLNDTKHSIPTCPIPMDEVEVEINVDQHSHSSPTPFSDSDNVEKSALKSLSPIPDAHNVEQLTAKSSPLIPKAIKNLIRRQPITPSEQVVPRTPRAPTLKNNDVEQLVPSTPLTHENLATSVRNGGSTEQLSVASNLISESKTEEFSMQLQLSSSKPSKNESSAEVPTVSDTNVKKSVEAWSQIPEIEITECSFVQETKEPLLDASTSSAQSNEIVAEKNTIEHLVTETELEIRKVDEKAENANIENAESVDQHLEIALSPENVEIVDDLEDIVDEANPVIIGDSESSPSVSVQVTADLRPESRKETSLAEGKVPSGEPSKKSDENSETSASPSRSPNNVVEMKTPSPVLGSKLSAENTTNNVHISGRKLSVVITDVQKILSPKGMSIGDTVSKMGSKTRNENELARAGDGSCEPQSEVRKSARKKLLKDQGLNVAESVSDVPSENRNKGGSASVIRNITVDIQKIDASEDAKRTMSSRRKTVQFKETGEQVEMKRSSRAKKNEKVRALTPKKPASEVAESKASHKRVVRILEDEDEDEDDVESLSPPKRQRIVQELTSSCSVVLKPMSKDVEDADVRMAMKNLNTKVNVAAVGKDEAKTNLAKGTRGYNTRRGKITASNENLAESSSDKENSIVNNEPKPGRKAKNKVETFAVEEKRSRRNPKVDSEKKTADEVENTNEAARRPTRHAKAQPAEAKKNTRRGTKVANEEPASRAETPSEFAGRATRQVKASAKQQPAETVVPVRNTRRGGKAADEESVLVAKPTTRMGSKRKISTSSSDEETSAVKAPVKRANLRQKTAQKKSDEVRTGRETAVAVRTTRNRNESKEVAAAAPVKIVETRGNTRSTRNRNANESAAAKTSSSSETKQRQNLSDSMTVTVVRADIPKMVAKTRSTSSEDEMADEATTRKRRKVQPNATADRTGKTATAEKNDDKVTSKGKKQAAKNVVGKSKNAKSSKKNESNSSDESCDEVPQREPRSRKTSVKREKSRPSPKNAKVVANRNTKQTKETVTKKAKKMSPENVLSPVSRVTRSRNPSVCATRSRTTKK